MFTQPISVGRRRRPYDCFQGNLHHSLTGQNLLLTIPEDPDVHYVFATIEPSDAPVNRCLSLGGTSIRSNETSIQKGDCHRSMRAGHGYFVGYVEARLYVKPALAEDIQEWPV